MDPFLWIIFLFFIEVCASKSKVSRFGYTPGSDEPHIQSGWLTHETVVQLKLQGSKAINVWKKKHAEKKLYVKVKIVNLRFLKDSSEKGLSTSSLIWPS